MKKLNKNPSHQDLIGRFFSVKTMGYFAPNKPNFSYLDCIQRVNSDEKLLLLSINKGEKDIKCSFFSARYGIIFTLYTKIYKFLEIFDEV